MAIQNVIYDITVELVKIAKEYQKESDPKTFNERWLDLANILGYKDVNELLNHEFYKPEGIHHYQYRRSNKDDSRN